MWTARPCAATLTPTLTLTLTLTLTPTLTPTLTLTPKPGARLRRTQLAAAHRQVGRRRPGAVRRQEAWRRRGRVATARQLRRSPQLGAHASRRGGRVAYRVLIRSRNSHAKLHTRPPCSAGKARGHIGASWQGGSNSMEGSVTRRSPLATVHRRRVCIRFSLA